MTVQTLARVNRKSMLMGSLVCQRALEHPLRRKVGAPGVGPLSEGDTLTALRGFVMWVRLAVAPGRALIDNSWYNVFQVESDG